MSMSDPIADMLTRVRNAQSASKKSVVMPSSKIKVAIAQLLKEEGYVADFRVEGDVKQNLVIDLKYVQGEPVISLLKRVSSPGLRQYRKTDELPKIQGGLGVVIVSTSKGLMTDRAARVARHGGEVICFVA